MKDLKAYEKMQRAIFEAAQTAPDQEPEHVPVGRCPRHPWIETGNGMFDAPCNLCEAEMGEPI